MFDQASLQFSVCVAKLMRKVLVYRATMELLAMVLMVWRWKLETACSECTKYMISVNAVPYVCAWYWGTNKQEGNVIPAVIYSAAFEIVAAAACMPAGA